MRAAAAHRTATPRRTAAMEIRQEFASLSPPCNSLSLWVSGFNTFYVYSTYSDSEGLSSNINIAENSLYFAEITHFAKIKKSGFLRTRFGSNKTSGMADMREMENSIFL